jgi:hypothetical protein
MKSKIFTLLLFLTVSYLLLSPAYANNIKDGFYGFPSTVDIKEGETKIIKGEFYHNFKSGLKDVVFVVEPGSGVEHSWYTIQPSEVDMISPQQYTPITIRLTAPAGTAGNSYKMEIGLECSNIDVSDFALIQNITINVKDATTTVSTTVPTTTILESNTTTVEENVTIEEVPTGEFSLASWITNYWYVIVIIIIVIVLIIFYIKRPGVYNYSKPSSYVSVEPKVKEEKEMKEISKKEEKIETIKTEMAPQDRLELARKRNINEMKQKAMEMDKEHRK